MKHKLKPQNQIRFLVLVFIFIGMLVLSTNYFEYKTIEKISKIPSEMYDHPFKVSNAVLIVKANVYKIHRNMKDIVLSDSQKEIIAFAEKVDTFEKTVYDNLLIIEQNILGDEGLALQKKTKELFDAWKPIRDEVIALMQADQMENARDITRGKGAQRVEQLESSTVKLYMYAQNRALNFKNTAEANANTLQTISLWTGLLFFLLFISVAYYVVKRLSNFIARNEHLKGVLAVIRDINQLIVREKDKQKLIQEGCYILTSSHVYTNAWIVLLDETHKIDYFTGAGVSSNFTLMKEKIDGGWIPPCVEKNSQTDKLETILKEPKQNCPACPFTNAHDNQSAYTVKLKHGEKIYGYLRLYIDKENIVDDEELSLLDEVAGDIAYALYNLEVEMSVHHLKELYDNIINSVENLLFVKDKNGVYLACNKAFEKLLGKSKSEIVGKTDYDFFDQELAEFFREKDKQTLLSNGAKSNFEWLTYPDGLKSYCLTVKAPLVDDNGNVFGIVGNSVDITAQKEAEEALNESEEQFKSLMEQSPSVIEIYNLEGLQIAVNHAYELLWGFPATHTLNKFNVLKSEEVKNTGLIVYINQAYAGQSVQVPLYQYNATGKTEADGLGRVRWLSTIIYPLKDVDGKVKSIVITHVDVTDKQEALALLEQKKKELETIIQEAPNPIMIHNESGEVLMLNKVWEDLTGYTKSEINTIEKWTTKAHGKEMPAVKKYIDELYGIKKTTSNGEYAITTNSGETIIWQFSTAPLGIIDGKRTIISSAMDITELKKKDELILTQSRHAAMGEMIGMIAHQWRQPISVIAMEANNQLLDIDLGDFNAVTARKYAYCILDQTEHLSETINDFRNFFKPDKATSKVKIEDVLSDTYPIVKDSLTNHNIALTKTYASETKVDVYPRELMQVFVNIINNAKDALITNHCDNPLIEVKVYEDEEYVITDICDNGKGIDMQILPQIFDPYFSTKDEKTGTGLGLYMSKMIVEKHLQGKIEAINQDNGVCLRVMLRKESVLTQ